MMGGPIVEVAQPPRARVRYAAADLRIADSTTTNLVFDTETYDYGNCFSIANILVLTGTVDKASGSTTLTGHGTAFLTQLAVGDMIIVPGGANDLRMVANVANDTSLTVDAAFASTSTGQTATKGRGRLSAPVNGTYLIQGNVVYNASATGTRSLTVRVNGTTAIASAFIGAASTGVTRQEISTTYELLAGDYVHLQAFQSSTAALSVNSTAEYTPVFSITRLAG